MIVIVTKRQHPATRKCGPPRRSLSEASVALSKSIGTETWQHQIDLGPGPIVVWLSIYCKIYRRLFGSAEIQPETEPQGNHKGLAHRASGQMFLVAPLLSLTVQKEVRKSGLADVRVQGSFPRTGSQSSHSLECSIEWRVVNTLVREGQILPDTVLRVDSPILFTHRSL